MVGQYVAGMVQVLNGLTDSEIEQLWAINEANFSKVKQIALTQLEDLGLVDKVELSEIQLNQMSLTAFLIWYQELLWAEGVYVNRSFDN